MDDTRLHDFRHSHVAYIIDKGEEPVLIKERLGYASITTQWLMPSMSDRITLIMVRECF